MASIATLEISFFWSARRKDWDVVIKSAACPTFSLRAATSTALDKEAVHLLADRVCRELEALIPF